MTIHKLSFRKVEQKRRDYRRRIKQTLEQYEKIRNERVTKTKEELNKYSSKDTFTIKTMHDGAHEYYRLTEQQKNELGEWSCSTGLLFKNKGMSIDVKYN